MTDGDGRGGMIGEGSPEEERSGDDTERGGAVGNSAVNDQGQETASTGSEPSSPSGPAAGGPSDEVEAG